MGSAVAGKDRLRYTTAHTALQQEERVTQPVSAPSSRCRRLALQSPGMRIGYGRVSTRDQNPDAQRDALIAAGCDQVFIDKVSGKLARRPELDRALLVTRPVTSWW